MSAIDVWGDVVAPIIVVSAGICEKIVLSHLVRELRALKNLIHRGSTEPDGSPPSLPSGS